MLIVAPKHAGKTTFILHLLSAGFAITGDELVLLRDREVIAFPRKFYLRDGSLPLLPGLAAALPRHLPFVTTPADGRLVAVDPTVFGRPWRIAPAPLAAILYLEPGHGGPTRVLSSGKLDIIGRVLPQCTPPQSGRPGWVADLCGTINGAETALLQIGDLASATNVLRGMLGVK